MSKRESPHPGRRVEKMRQRWVKELRQEVCHEVEEVEEVWHEVEEVWQEAEEHKIFFAEREEKEAGKENEAEFEMKSKV